MYWCMIEKWPEPKVIDAGEQFQAGLKYLQERYGRWRRGEISVANLPWERQGEDADNA